MSDFHPHNRGIQCLGEIVIYVKLLAQLQFLNSYVPTDFFHFGALTCSESGTVYLSTQGREMQKPGSKSKERIFAGK